jgi:hypothetical protein
VEKLANDLVDAEDAGPGPGDGADKGAPGGRPDPHDRGNASAVAKAVVLGGGEEAQAAPEWTEENTADEERQPEAAEVPPGEIKTGGRHHAAVGGWDVGVHAGRRVRDAVGPAGEAAAAQEVILRTPPGEPVIVEPDGEHDGQGSQDDDDVEAADGDVQRVHGPVSGALMISAFISSWALLFNTGAWPHTMSPPVSAGALPNRRAVI